MMTGILNVSNFPIWYQLLTLLFLVPFAWYDAKHHKIRNAALLAFFPWCLLSVTLNLSAIPFAPLTMILLYHFMGFVSGSMILFFISLGTNGSIGGGDIKMVALLGMIYGISGILCMLIVASLFSLLYLGLQSLQKRQHVHHIPFVPFLLLFNILHAPNLFLFKQIKRRY